MATKSIGKGAAVATLAIVCLVFFIDIANLGMANIALPTIQKELGYDEGSLQWILTAYALTFGGFLMVGGRVGDIFGQRVNLIAGMTLYNAGTLLCALVNDKIALVVGRAVQGLAAAFTIPAAQSMVALSFEDPKSRIRAFGVWGASGFGPIFGGLFTSLVTWRWIFWISLVVEGSLEIVALVFLVTDNLPGAPTSGPKDENGRLKWSELATRLDPAGTCLSIVALILLVYGLTTGNVHGWGKADVVATLVVSVVLVAVFALVQLKFSSDPILPRYLWSDRIKMLGCLIAALTYAIWQGSNYLLTLELQSFGFSPLSTALRFLPLGITAMCVNFVIPIAIQRVPARTLLLISWPVCAAGLALLTAMADIGDYWRLCLPGEILYIAGVGTIYFVGNIKVVATAKAEQQGTVSGVYNMFLNIGGAVLGVAVLTVISDSVASNHGDKDRPSARLDGYRAGYYGTIAMAVIGLVASFFFYDDPVPEADEEMPVVQESVDSSLKTSREMKPEEEAPAKDKAYRRYASGVEKALSLFETALEEWADYISFLNRVLKALQARPPSNTTIPAKALLSKRLSQCLNPTLPSGVHQKAIEVYTYVFDTIGADGLSRDLPLYLPGLAPTLSFASLSVRSPFLELLEKYFVKLDARSLRPAMRSIILALLPGLEDETSEDFDRTLKLVQGFKKAIRPIDSRELTDHHSVGDDFFWQCFFLASITSHSRRAGALAYLIRYFPALGTPTVAAEVEKGGQELATMVTSPEPGLLVRCFASGLADEQVLVQRGYLDLLVSHLPLNSNVLQARVKPSDLELLLKSAVGVVIRREMSLNRRLWAWLLGPEPAVPDNENAHDVSGAPTEQQHAYLSSRTQYFEEHGLAALTRALLGMIEDAESSSVPERARPYRICLSLMDRWEIGGLVVPEIFLPVVESVQRFKNKTSSPAEFKEVLRSASVFFDGIESGLIYSEIVALFAQAIAPGTLATKQRSEKLSLISFIIANFNVREEEMVTIHAPLTCLAALYMLQDLQERQNKGPVGSFTVELVNEVLSIVASFLDLVPERTFLAPPTKATTDSQVLSLSNMDLLKKIRDFYVNEQGNLDSSPAPFTGLETGRLLIQLAAKNLQTALTLERRDIEAALSTLIVEKKSRDNADTGRTFGVLWSHTLQDNQGERRGSRTTSLIEPRSRAAGADFYEVMLTQPLFLVLDALMDERTHLYMNVKSWLNTMVGIDSQLVLDSWMNFLGGCLPLYGGSVFQIVIPLVETLCKQIGTTFANLRATFGPENNSPGAQVAAPETTLIYLLNGLEQVLARAHDQLLADEARAQVLKSPDQPQSLFGSMVSGVFQSDAPQGRSATANDRLTVHLAFQDAVRICYKIWSWGQGDDAAANDTSAAASFMYTSLRMRNRARRLLEQLFTAETLECLETIVDIWKQASSEAQKSEVFKFLAALEASRPRQTVPSIFNSIYSRTNPGALDPSRTSTLTISLEDTDLGLFLVRYTQSLDDDAMDEIWQDCIVFLRDILANPFPHRQTLPSLLEFAAILGEKVDNTNFGEQRKMRRELGDLFIRLLAGLFTTRPMTFAEPASSNATTEKPRPGGTTETRDVVGILASVVPNLSKVLPEPDRVLSAAGTISTNVIGPTLRTKTFPDSVTHSTVRLLQELSRLPNNHKSWKKDVGDAFNDGRFFGMNLALVTDDWLPLLRQWAVADKDKLPEIVSRVAAPTTAGIVFGVGATSARLEADRKTQLNLRRVATLVLAGADDAAVADLAVIVDKLVELLAATSTSSPSSTTRADVYMVMRALVLRTDPLHLAMLWPVVNAELHAALSSVVAPDGSAAAETHTNAGVLQACKLLDLLVCVAPDDFQLHEWLFITDSIDAVYRSSSSRPIALADELAEDLGSAAATTTTITTTHQDDGGAGSGYAGLVPTAQRNRRHVLIGPGGIADDVGLERRDELVAKVLRPFFGQLSIFAFESTYAMGAPDVSDCVQGLLRDLFDDRTMVKAL
ncbi:hypothetical protein MY3296_001128 [Beauveria thailandica]